MSFVVKSCRNTSFVVKSVLVLFFELWIGLRFKNNLTLLLSFYLILFLFFLFFSSRFWVRRKKKLYLVMDKICNHRIFLWLTNHDKFRSTLFPPFFFFFFILKTLFWNKVEYDQKSKEKKENKTMTICHSLQNYF